MFGMIQVLGITYVNLNVTKNFHIPFHSTFEAYGKRPSLVRYMLFFLWGCVRATRSLQDEVPGI